MSFHGLDVLTEGILDGFHLITLWAELHFVLDKQFIRYLGRMLQSPSKHGVI